MRPPFRLVLLVLLLAAPFSVSSLAAAETEEKASEVLCPISGKKVSPEVWTFSDGKKVGFCCERCQAKFAAERENRLTESQAKEGWKLVFNGRDLAGFQEPTRDGKWTVRDGVLHATGGPGVLATKARYRDFVLRFDARVSDTGTRRGNSGVFIRSTGLLAYRGRWPDGLEVQIDHGDPEFWTGALFRVAAAKPVRTKDGEWFGMRIEARGRRVRVWVDGELVTEHEQAGAVHEGPLAFQVHHPTDVVELKNIKVRPAAKTAAD